MDKLISDGKYSVYSGETEIARSYIGFDGYEVRVLQGMDRMKTIERICDECPEFAEENGLTNNYYPRLFGTPKKKPVNK